MSRNPPAGEATEEYEGTAFAKAWKCVRAWRVMGWAGRRQRLVLVLVTAATLAQRTVPAIHSLNDRR